MHLSLSFSLPRHTSALTCSITTSPADSLQLARSSLPLLTPPPPRNSFPVPQACVPRINSKPDLGLALERLLGTFDAKAQLVMPPALAAANVSGRADARACPGRFNACAPVNLCALVRFTLACTELMRADAHKCSATSLRHAITLRLPR